MGYLICRAIRDHFLIRFLFKGEWLEVEPFTVGYQDGTGQLVLVGFRTSKTRTSRQRLAWQVFPINQMSSLTVMQESKVELDRPGYELQQIRMSRTICSIVATPAKVS